MKREVIVAIVVDVLEGKAPHKALRALCLRLGDRLAVALDLQQKQLDWADNIVNAVAVDIRDGNDGVTL